MDKAAMDVPVKVKKSSRDGKALKEAFEERVKIIMDTILENVDNRCIKKIYLFGSYAYGRPNKNSIIKSLSTINNFPPIKALRDSISKKYKYEIIAEIST
jgi:predicted nucleotidyltransferase